MLTSSSPSPTLSPASASPQPSFHNRFYHASYRNPTSTSPSTSRANSPRYTPVGPPRRMTATATSASPVPPITHAAPASPPSPKRPTVDAGTQYSPPGLPPTYRRQTGKAPKLENPAAKPPSPTLKRRTSSEISPKSAPLQTHAPEPASTDPPPEPELRVEPPPPAARDVRQISIPAAASSTEENTMQESPSKRARPDEPLLKTMPVEYEFCDVKDLGVLISDMLLELVRLNDLIPLKDGQLTRFHSRAPPAISVKDYLNRLIVHATLSPPILLSMVFYVDKLCALYPAFTISSLTVHRFLITAATVASKGLSDSFWTNSVYARVGGVSTKELALLEVEFLRKVEWRIVPKPEVLIDYYKGLVERGRGYRLEGQPHPEVASPDSSGSSGSSSLGGDDDYRKTASD